MTWWQRLAPGLRTLAGYKREWLGRDVLAGLVLAAIAVPAGMAYAQLAGLPPIYGLYASIVPFVVYAVFGPSPAIVMGPDSSTAPLVAATIIPLAVANVALRVQLAAALAVLVGAMALVVGVARLGFITDLLSKPVRIGYMNGIALVVVVSQLPKLFGFSAGGDTVYYRLLEFSRGVGKTNAISLGIGVAALALILLMQAFAPKVPGALIAVAASTILTARLGLAARGVATLGTLPRGLPAFRLPLVGLGPTLSLVAGAVGIAVISLTDASILSQSFASRFRYSVDADEEFVALGAVNVATGFFQGFPVSGSSTRSATNAAAGARSQLAGVVAAVLVGLLLVFAPGLLKSLPLSVLGAVIVAAGLSLADVSGTMRLFAIRRTEFYLSMIAFLGVVVLGVLPGVFAAVALSMLNFIRRQWWPHDAVLGRVPGVKGYHDTGDFVECREVPGLLLYRFDAPLFFANARIFRERLLARLELEHDVRWIVIAAEPLIDVDTTAADTLTDLIRELSDRGIKFGFAELKHPVLVYLERYGIIALIGDEMLFPTIGSAVHAYLSATGTEWTDWEEAQDSED